ncbi:hypothetical protein ScPMuIL_012569 [Solemya velum]
MDLTKAAETCFENGAYIASPKSSVVSSVLARILMEIPLFSNFDLWWTGIQDAFYTGHYMYADGSVAREPNSELLESADEISYSLVFRPGITSIEAMDDGNEFPVVCEKNPSFRGYFDVKDNSPSAALLGCPWMTVTQCIAFCGASNTVYAGTSGNDCYCSNHTGVEMKELSLYEGCPGHTLQPCGTMDGAVSIFDIRQASIKFESCDDLFVFGVYEPGWYYIEPEDAGNTRLVQCFTHNDPYNTIQLLEDAFSASSSTEGYPPSAARMTYPLSTSDLWRAGSADKDQWLRVELEEDYIVTGIIFQGEAGAIFDFQWKNKEQEWVTLTSFQGTLLQLTAGLTVRRHYFGNPAVTSAISVLLQAGSGNTGLQLQLIGQKYRYFNQSHHYIGCYGNYSSTQAFADQGVLTTENCKLDCSQFGYPFMAWGSDGQCLCRNNIDTYGRLNDSQCQKQCLQPHDDILCGNNGQSIAVYRTYNTSCGHPTPVANATENFEFAHVSGIFTFQSRVEYTCLEGYVFPGGSTVKVSVCLQDHKWNETYSDCQKVQCGEPHLPDHLTAVIATDYYNDIASLTCDHGHELEDNRKEQIITCGADSKWSAILSCRKVKCPILTLSNAHYSNERTYDTAVLVSCYEGYIFEDGSKHVVIECLASGEWDFTPEHCQARSCGTPPEVQNANYSNNGITVNATVTYTCHAHTRFGKNKYEHTAWCNSYGNWANIPVPCVLYECASPPPMAHATATMTSPTEAYYDCQKFYYFSDGHQQKASTCDPHSNFLWSSVNDECTFSDKDIAQKQGEFAYRGKQRYFPSREATILMQMSTRGFVDCATTCIDDINCVAYNYNVKMQETYNCILFTTTAKDGSLHEDSQWHYYELEETIYIAKL